MKKQGIVLAIEQNKIIVLTDEGEFLERTLPKNPPVVGEKIDLKEEKHPLKLQKLALVAVFLIFTLSFSFLRPLLMPAAVAAVSFDLPVGIELEVDQKNKVVMVIPKDEQSKTLAAELNLKGMDIYLAANQLVEASLGLENLATNSENPAILITVIPLKEQEKMRLNCHLLNERMQETLEAQDFNGYFILQDGDYNLREKAAQLDLPVAKYLLWERSNIQTTEPIDLEELKACSYQSLIPQDEVLLEKQFPGMWRHHQGKGSGGRHHGGKNQNGMGRRGMNF